MKTFLVLLFAMICFATASLLHAQPTCLVITTETIFTNSCIGQDPLPDGMPVCFYHDMDNDGPDWEDQTVNGAFCNFVCFVMNGGEILMETAFCFEWDSMPNPALFLRICYTNVNWVSEVFTPPPGPSEIVLDNWICQSGPCGPLTADRIPASAAPASFALHPNYPNPFNPQTRIVFDVPRVANVSVRVYNTAGQQVAELQNGMLSAGRHTIVLDGQALPSGVYFCQLSAGEYRGQIKMVMMK